FASLCDDDGTDVSIATVAALRKSACLADDTESPDCPGIITAEGVNTDIWTARAVEDNGTTKLTIRETVKKVYAENDSPTEFLTTDATSETELDAELGDVANLESPDVNWLTLNDSTTNNNLGGSDESGAFSFRAVWPRVEPETEDTIKFFAGILPETNLGVPLAAEEGAPTTATWHGFLSLDRGESSLYQLDDLVLTIDFTNDIGTITSTPTRLTLLDVSTVGSPNAGTFEINGKFDEYGLVYGTVGLRLNGSLATEHTGTLTGLIGEKGVVGAFISNNDDEQYGGAFVANGKVCSDNPFHRLCGTQFNDIRQGIVDTCSANPAPVPDDKNKCAVFKPLLCAVDSENINPFDNPFAPLCEDVLGIAGFRQEACLE
ncbi:MAG: hypothetical protein K8953_01955, partial [Proteobacteria bacterium]|nr:hypothetical protein [Pseudomonadota bacterium]